MSAAHTPMYVIAAKVLCQRSIEMCDVRFEDAWNKYGEHYLRDAQAMLDAIGAPDLLYELEISIKHEYNPFEPDNQSDRYKRMTALFAKATGAAS